ncbi:MAG TPA: glycosyltransferase [Burkholderiaceae bacterium]|nr:glycosyltransferase [Burkholderiaceae bacterium]
MSTTVALHDGRLAATRPLLIDDSLSLINRTGAHFVAQDLVDHFGADAWVRRWRGFGAALPRPPLLRKLLGRMMLKEMAWLGDRPVVTWPERSSPLRLYLDPLYVLRGRLQASDIVLCHDIGPIRLARLYPPRAVELYRRAYAKVVTARPGIVFVSRSSQAAFVSEFGSDFRFLGSIPLYVRAACAEGPGRPVPAIDTPFLLSVGALEQRKNHLRTIEAFARSGLVARGVSLVICGARGDATAAITREASRTPGVRLVGYVSDAQLRWLYRQAAGFVLPSLLEGFGLPALEASLYGLVPIVSKDSALNEAVGGLGLAVDADDADQIATAMRLLIDLDPATLRARGERLKAHARTATRERFIAAWSRLLAEELALP